MDKKEPAVWVELLSVKQVAQMLGVSPWTIRAWLSQGKMRRTKVGGRTMIRSSELQKVIYEEPDTYESLKAQNGKRL